MERLKQRFLSWLAKAYSLVASSRRTQTPRAQAPETQTSQATQQDKGVPEDASTVVHPVSNHLLSFHPPNLNRQTHIPRTEPSPFFHSALTKSKPRPQRTKSFRFLDLPAELRLEIYTDLLPLTHSKDKSNLSLLYVSRLLHTEVAYLLYTTTPLVLITKGFSGLASTDLTKIGTRNSSWLRSLSWEWRFNEVLSKAEKTGDFSSYLQKTGDQVAEDLNLVATWCPSLKRLALTFPPPAVQGRTVRKGADVFGLWKPVREALGRVKVVEEVVVWNTWAVEEVEEVGRKVRVKIIGVGWGKGFSKAIKWRRRRRLRGRGWDIESVGGGPNAVLCTKDLSAKVL